MADHFLTKTKIKIGKRCHKALRLSQQSPKRQLDRATMFRIEEGNQIGKKAREQFPQGELIDTLNPSEALNRTNEEIQKQREVLFEPAFSSNGAFVRIDILRKTDGGWELIEVKGAKSISDEHVEDAAIQTWVVKASGLDVIKVSLMHLNPDCRFPDLTNLFVTQDVTAKCLNINGIDQKIRELSAVLALKEAPKIDVGLHCDEPNECDFKSSCMAGFPQPSVFELPGIGPKKGWKLVADGKRTILDLKGTKQSDKVLLTIHAHELGKPIMKTDAFRSTVESWQFPMYFLDFETLGPAIPRYQGCGPYDEVPFQFSLHTQQSLDSKVTHDEYLHLETSDPRRAIAERLVQLIGAAGSIVAFNAYVEKGIVKKLAALYSDLAPKLESIADRIVDPLPVFRENIVHAGFKGGYSIKDITPVLIGPHLDYALLEVKDGMEARSLAESLMRTGVATSEQHRQREALLKYCKQDTLAMVELTKWMRDPK